MYVGYQTPIERFVVDVDANTVLFLLFFSVPLFCAPVLCFCLLVLLLLLLLFLLLPLSNGNKTLSLARTCI